MKEQATDLRSAVDRHVASDIGNGLTRGMQVYVARNGLVLLNSAYGVRGQDATPITTSTRFAVFSTTKPITATALHVLVDQGHLAYEDPVTRFVPQYGQHGKGGTTVRHLLLHQAGIPDADERIPMAAYDDFADAIARICTLEPVSAPGARVDYHVLTGYAVLAAVIERVSGVGFRAFCQSHVLNPLGMTRTTHGLPAEFLTETTDTIGRTPERETVCAQWRQARNQVHPAIGGYSTASDLGRLLQMWLDGGELDGTRVLTSATVAAATSLQAQLSSTFGFGYGFMVGADPHQPSSRGRLCGPRTFGHPGMCSSQALADPDHGLVVALLANVDPGQVLSDQRFASLVDLIYQNA